MVNKKRLEDIFIIDALRTPIGGGHKSLKEYSAVQLAAVVTREILKRNNVGPQLIDEMVLGNTVAAGLGQNLSRQALCLSGLPVTTPAYTVNAVCGSGLQAVVLCARAIGSGQGDLFLAGGTESASQCPSLITHKGGSQKQEESLIVDGLWCSLSDRHMGGLAEYIVEKYRISRKDQDQFALESHQKACLAQSQGKFQKEIVPVPLSKNEFFSADEKPRKNISLTRLAALPAAFEENGTVTAGNSSSPADGAAVLLLASQESVRKNGWKPIAKLTGYSMIGVEPQEVFTAAIPSIIKCLGDAGLTLKEIDLIEVTEAFAAQAILTRDELKIPEEKYNVHGGDIALGHPLGTSGARALVTLIHALRSRKKKRGLVSVCLGGGGAVTLAVENLAEN